MTSQTAVATDFRIAREPDGPFAFEDTRTGERFVSRGQVATLAVQVAGTHPRRVFDALAPGFEDAVRARLREALELQSANQRVLGVFLDDAPSFRGQGHWASHHTYTLLEEALDRPEGDPAREAALSFLKRRFPSYEWFAGAWGLDIAGRFETLTGRHLATGYNIETQSTRARFEEDLADAYFGALARALRSEAPASLNLGVRFAEEPPVPVLKACGKHCDVISFGIALGDAALARAWMTGGKPILITALPGDAPQSAADLLRHPMVIGVHESGGAQTAMDACTAEREVLPFPTTCTPLDAVFFVPGPIADKALQVDLIAEEPALDPVITLLGAGASALLEREEAGAVLRGDTGTAGGFHVLFAGPRRLHISNAPEGATDLNGYTRLLLDAEIPEGIEFKLYIYEGGVDFATSDEFDTRGGDEGQAFETNVFIARAGRRRYTYRIDRLIPQTHGEARHGNQSGSGAIHLESARGVCVALKGGQGAVTIRLHGLKLYRG
jgi:hypothetical protein